MSAQRPAVLLALTPIEERAIEPLLFGQDAAVQPSGSAIEADELERLAAERHASAVLLSPRLSGLTVGHCHRVRARRLRLVGVSLDEHDQRALQDLGVDTIIDTTAKQAQLLAAVQDEERPAQVATPQSPPPPAIGERRDGEGTVLAVLGCKGAPGASECAASLAALAAERWQTLLVDLDMLGGGLDVRLGADPQRGSLLAAARAAASGEQAILALIDRWVHHPPGWPAVLLAAPDPKNDAHELAGPGMVAGALSALRRRFPLVVCDVGFQIDTPDPAPPARVHREAITCADAVLLVLGARDAHLRLGLAQLDVLLDQLGVRAERLRVIANGIGGPGAFSESALNQTLLPRLAEQRLTADAWLPWDHRALERARRKGAPLATAKRNSRYARVLTRLLDELFLPTEPRPRARKQRLAAPARPRAIETQMEEVALPWNN